MQNGRNTNMNRRQFRPAASSASHATRWVSSAARPEPKGPQNAHHAQRNYERYLALAQAELRAGDRIAAENYYQHAEHYFRSMSSGPGGT